MSRELIEAGYNPFKAIDTALASTQPAPDRPPRKPPQLDEIDEMNFVVSYFMQGCKAPFWLFLEFAKEPASDLALLFLGLDATDIAQEIIQPKGQRGRRPGRHGRKAGRFRGFPDPNDAVGAGLRGYFNPFDAYNAGPTRRIFQVVNPIEGFNFTMAAIGGFSDLGFESLYGIISHNPELCPNLAWLDMRRDRPEIAGGVLGTRGALLFDIHAGSQNFSKDTGISFASHGGPCEIMFHVEVENTDTETARGVEASLWLDNEKRIAHHVIGDLAPGAKSKLWLNGKAAHQQQFLIRAGSTYGFIKLTKHQLFAFSFQQP